MEQGNSKPTKNMHYLSQCIIKKFKKKGYPLYEYNVKTKSRTEKKAVKNLFAGHLIWKQDTENMLSHSYESKLGPLLHKLCTDSFTTYETKHSFNYFELTNQNDILTIQKLIFQSQLVMRAEDAPTNTESSLASFQSSISLGVKVFLLEVLPEARSSPLILVDSNGLFFCRMMTNNLKNLEIGFCFPINETRIILLSNDEAMLKYFTKTFQDINLINLERILFNKKDCCIASQHKQYLEKLSNEIESYQSILPQTATIPRNSNAIPKTSTQERRHP